MSLHRPASTRFRDHRATPKGETMNEAGRRANVTRPLTHSSDLTREGLAMEPTRDDLKTCTKCHAAKPLSEYQRQASQPDGRKPVCKPCTAEANKARYAQKQAEILAKKANYREARRDQLTEAQASYREAHPEANWRGNYRRRARHFGFEPVAEMFTRADVVAAYGDGCYYCEDGAFEEPDHLVPVCQGGTHVLSNVRPCCGPCNRAKAASERATR